jgi:hypothetical protein
MALSAICGSLVGALGSSLSAWIAQRHHDRQDLLANKTAHREQLYSNFIRESGQALSSPQGSERGSAHARRWHHHRADPRDS